MFFLLQELVGDFTVLAVEGLCIIAVFRHQFLVGTLLDDPASIHYKDQVGGFYGGNPVSHDKYSAVLLDGL